MPEIDFLILGVAGRFFACRQGGLHIGIADLDPRLHLALLQAVDQKLIAQLPPKRRLRGSTPLQVGTQLHQVQLVLGGDIGFRLVNRCGIHAHAGFPGQLELSAFYDDALQHSGPKLGSGRKRPRLGPAALYHLPDLGLQLAMGNGL